MNAQNKTRIHWACRRGMKELDMLIMPFFEHEYDALSAEEQAAFVALLEYQDPQLFSWLMNQARPEDDGLAHIIELIQKRNRDHGLSTV